MSKSSTNDNESYTYADILYITLHHDDYDLGYQLCQESIDHEDVMMRAAALEGLGFLAKRFGKMDLGFVLPHIRQALQDPNSEVADGAESALYWFEEYLPGFRSVDHGLPEPVRYEEWDEEDGIRGEILGTALRGDTYEEGLALCKHYSGHENPWVHYAISKALAHLARRFNIMDIDFAVAHFQNGVKKFPDDGTIKYTRDYALDEFERSLPGFDRAAYGFGPTINPAPVESRRELIWDIQGTVLYDPSYQKGIDLCLLHMDHLDEAVSNRAIDGLSQLARRFGKMDLDKTIPRLRVIFSHPTRKQTSDVLLVLDAFERYLPGFNRQEYGFPPEED